MPFIVHLKPNERAIVGGAVIRNGGGRADLLIENEVPVLRERDILGPAAVNTPAERVYLSIQLMYVDASVREENRGSYEVLTHEIREAAPSCRELLDAIDLQVRDGNYYQALRTARRLRDRERELIRDVR
jgi:flagellar protein FlbT